MEFRILGSLYADAATGLGPATIRQPLLRSALAVLLLRANLACAREWLIEALWGSEPPAAPDASLRVCISRLRRDLGDCAPRLESVGPPGGRAPGHRLQRGYKMRVRPGELDLEEFSDLASQGRAELDMGNADAAAVTLAQALALWGDPPLPDLPGTPVVLAALAELHVRRRAAEEDLIEARLAAGEYEQVLGQLRAAVLADPAYERTSMQLMRAYRALGMRKEALEVYQRTRRATLAELGAEPGPTVAILHRRILADELATQGMAGQLSGLEQTGPRLPFWQVPAPPPDFAGRADEIHRITEGLAGPGVPVTVVTGLPGAGKTVTAAAAALHLRSTFFDGQLYAELGGPEHPRDPQQILGDLLHSLGIPAKSIPPAGPARGALYRSLLADRKVLVVADDAASAHQIRMLLPGGSGAAVLVTSRGRLTGLAGARIVELGELAGDDALALLSSAAGPDRFAADPAATTSVISACAGLPLALRIAGLAMASQPGMTIRELAAELSGNRPLDVLAAEEMSVSAAFSSSYYALPSSARAAIALAAALMPGDVPAWALTELASGHPADPAGAGDSNVAGVIVAAGLIAPAPGGSRAVRYRLHPLVRAYAAQRQGEHGESSAKAVYRLRKGWLLRADEADARLPAVPFIMEPLPVPDLPSLRGNPIGAPTAPPGPAVSLDWLDAEQDNLLAVVDGACDSGDHMLAGALASRVIAGQCIRARYSCAIRMWRSIAAAAARAGDKLAAARASYYLAVGCAEACGRLDEAAGLLTASAPVLEESGDVATAAMAHGLLGRCASASGRHALAVRSARAAQRLAGGGLTTAAASAVLGLTLARVGMTSLGEENCHQALREARALGEPAYEAAALRALAQVLILAGQCPRAAALCAEGVRTARSYSSEITAARFLLLLGRARQRCQDWLAAAASLTEALEIFSEVGSAAEEVSTSSMLAACYRSAGNDGQAAAYLDRLAQVLARRGNDGEVSTATLRACETAAN